MVTEEGKAAEVPVEPMTVEQIADSYPEAVESWRAEGREEGRTAGKTEALENLKALAEALPGRPEAVLKAAQEGQTPTEAKAALADELAAENAELRQKADAIAAAAGGDAVSTTPASDGSGAGEDFVSRAKAVAKEKKISLKEAMSELATEEPDLFKAFKAGLRK